MKPFVLALIAAVAIAVLANLMLNEIGFSAKDATSSPNVRLDEQG